MWSVKFWKKCIVAVSAKLIYLFSWNSRQKSLFYYFLMNIVVCKIKKAFYIIFTLKSDFSNWWRDCGNPANWIFRFLFQCISLQSFYSSFEIRLFVRSYLFPTPAVGYPRKILSSLILNLYDGFGLRVLAFPTFPAVNIPLRYSSISFLVLIKVAEYN